jgi:hypothetical protein
MTGEMSDGVLFYNCSVTIQVGWQNASVSHWDSNSSDDVGGISAVLINELQEGTSTLVDIIRNVAAHVVLRLWEGERLRLRHTTAVWLSSGGGGIRQRVVFKKKFIIRDPIFVEKVVVGVGLGHGRA